MSSDINPHNDILQVNAEKISKLTGLTPEEVAVLKRIIAKNITDTELAYFLLFCKDNYLNALNKEAWCYKDKRNNLIIFAGRDGFLKKAQQSDQWDGMLSCEVCENDHFERKTNINTESNKYVVNIVHEINCNADRGKIIGAYAIVKPKNISIPTVEWADFAVYNKGEFTWLSHPAEMIRKVAETHALKKAFGISGLQSEYDFEIKNDIAIPINTTKSEIEIVRDNVIAELDHYNGSDKESLKALCAQKWQQGEFTLDFVRKEIAPKIGLQL